MLATLVNGVIFKKAFTDKDVLEPFVHDFLGIDFKAAKIETEKKFAPPVGGIDFAYDIYAESEDQRVIVEMQRVRYEVNFDRFLHYHCSGIIEQQRKFRAPLNPGDPVEIKLGLDKYIISRDVYTIVMLAKAYDTMDRTGKVLREPLLVVEMSHKNPAGEKWEIYHHKMIFINPQHPYSHLEPQYRDWMDLLVTSFAEEEAKGRVNMGHKGVGRVVDLIDYEHITPSELHEMKMQAEADEVLAKALDKLKRMEDKLTQMEEMKIERDCALEAKNIAEKKSEEAKKETAEANQQRDLAMEQTKAATVKTLRMAKRLIDSGMSMEEVTADLGLSVEECQKLIGQM